MFAKIFFNSLFDPFLIFPVHSLLKFSYRIIIEIRHQNHVMTIKVEYYVFTFYN